MLASMRFFEGDLSKARCRQPDVDPSWWMEPDYEVEVDGEFESSIEMARAHQQARAKEMVQTREDNLRAKILCHECPLYNQCQDYAWLEGTHVWGGLDGPERFNVLKAGTWDALPKPAKGRFLEQNEIIDRFLKGESVEGVALSTGRSVSTVFNRIRGTLAALRKEREDNEWNSSRPLPSLPQGMDRAAFRHGAALSQTWESDSA